MVKSKRIFFTGGGGAASEALWRLLSNRHDLHFGDANRDAISPSIPDERCHNLPYANDEKFIPEIAELCNKLQINLLVPGVDEELLPLCLSRETGNIPEIFAPSADFVSLMLDKLKCLESIKLMGLSAPKTLPIDQAAEIDFPLIVKPRRGRGSRGVRVLNSTAEIEAYKTLYQLDSQSLIAQEFVHGVEYTVCVAGNKKGHLMAIVPVKVIYKKGITIRAKIENDPRIIDYARQFQETFKVSGVYNIQCMLNREGKVLPFEVNPRISTTFCLAIASGFDPFQHDESSDEKIFLPKIELYLKRNWYNNIYSF